MARGCPSLATRRKRGLFRSAHPVHRIHRQARIHHANPGQGAGTGRRAGEPGPQRPAGRQGASQPALTTTAVSSAATTMARPHHLYPPPSRGVAPLRHRAASGLAAARPGADRRLRCWTVRGRPGQGEPAGPATPETWDRGSLAMVAPCGSDGSMPGLRPQWARTGGAR